MKNLFFLILLLYTCGRTSIDRNAQAAQEIKSADIAMSQLATEIGFYKALLTYAEDSVILPIKGELPLIGKSAAALQWAVKPIITGLTWEPVKVEASASGDMGYSFGFATNKQQDTIIYTNYCTIWRKQKNGAWKFVYDAGNTVPSLLIR